MEREEIKALAEGQRRFWESGATLPKKFRKEALKKLYSAIKSNEDSILDALYADLGKCRDEAFMCEVGLTLTEISYLLKNLNRLVRRKRVKTPLAQFRAKSYTLPTPYGTVLIMSPWNYPFLLTVEPLCDAIAAGNTAIVKPSAYSPKTSEVIAKIISDVFPPEYVATVTGGRAENTALLEEKFDMIFFTGSSAVGKTVLRSAAENLTPCVLELGGKSPCIVDSTAKIPLAARRIVFGKLINCGQTCVAPDYILCDKKIEKELTDAIVSEIKRQYGESPLEKEDHGRIVNKKHFQRLLSLIDESKVVFGGRSTPETLQIEPTVMSGVSLTDAVMAEEIFGPIFPIISYDTLDCALDMVKGMSKPLALYIFSENKENIKAVTERVRFGGGCVNDTIIHLATSEMGFGGVGESGMGAYHGEVGFSAFSHTKSIVDKGTAIDLGMRYRPYGNRISRWLIRKFLK